MPRVWLDGVPDIPWNFAGIFFALWQKRHPRRVSKFESGLTDRTPCRPVIDCPQNQTDWLRLFSQLSHQKMRLCIIGSGFEAGFWGVDPHTTWLATMLNRQKLPPLPTSAALGLLLASHRTPPFATADTVRVTQSAGHQDGFCHQTTSPITIGDASHRNPAQHQSAILLLPLQLAAPGGASRNILSSHACSFDCHRGWG